METSPGIPATIPERTPRRRGRATLTPFKRRPFSWPEIPSRHRVCIIGPTGSGKTQLARALLVTRRNAIAVDTKRTEDWSEFGPVVYGEEIYRAKAGRFAFAVPGEFLVDETLPERFFRWALRNRNRVIYCDELLDIMPVPALKILATQGRSANVGLWTATQRPSGVPLYTISEAQHYFIFYLRLPQDRERMEIATGTEIPWSMIGPGECADPECPECVQKQFSFFYVNERGTIFGPAKLNLDAD